nr:uncharacterized protein K02A2.6-like [Rhipicephalus microplus]
MELLKPPDRLCLTGNVQKNWQLFKQKFELFLQATEPATRLTEAARTARLLTAAGDDALEVFNNFTFAEGENKQDYQTVVKKFEEYCAEQQNEVYERYVFRTRTQDEAEPVEHFIRDLRKQARYCNFGPLADSMIRDQIVFGSWNTKLREKMLREKDLTLQKAEQICKAAELANKQNEAWQGNEARVDATEKRYLHRTQGRKAPVQCCKCNRRHEPRKCPAFGKICRACAGRNHFAVCCRKYEVDEVQEEKEDFAILDVTVCGIQKTDWIVKAQVGQQEVAFKVDTGSQANLLPLSVYKRFRTNPPLRASNSVLRSYSGNAIMHYGVTTQVITINERRCLADFFVVKRGQSILGLELAESLALVSRVVDFVTTEGMTPMTQRSLPTTQKFSHLFEGTGCVKRQYRMVLHDDAVPVIHAARRVPLALREPLQKELVRMEQANIICKVDEPTDWVSPLVIVRKKDGSLRVCMDPRSVNACLKREHYQMPQREDIEAELSGANFFSRLDANAGFHQIPLDEPTSKICTFATPFGRYRFLRLPFGIASAPEVFQKTLSEIFDHLPGVRVYIDDILVWGATKQEHDSRLQAALCAAQRAGLTFNRAKCQFGVQKIVFLGDVISSAGIRPNAALVDCLSKMPVPTEKLAVQRMLGVINYFGKYVPTLADRTKLLRSLIRKDTVFDWTEKHAQEWHAVCEALRTAPLLAIFDPAKETKITADASKDGIGAALLQRHSSGWRPIAYASRAMTDVEKRYSQIEKEAMGIAYGCEKFHQFVYGRKIVIDTDHKPLLAISSKDIGNMPPRLQRFFLRLLIYDYVLQFVPGKELVLADMLSRATPSEREDTVDFGDIQVHAVAVLSSLVSERTKQLLSRETSNDPELRAVVESLSLNKDFEGTLKPFASELSVVDGILLKGCKVVIPKKLRPETLSRIHEGHLGLNKCKARARRLVFWPGLNSDIADVVRNCAVCKTYAYKQPDEPLLLRTPPDHPWYRVGVDLFCYAGATYLAVFDAYSNFPEVEKLEETSATAVIDKLAAIFARYGIPMEVCTDNGPQFASHQFATFSRRMAGRRRNFCRAGLYALGSPTSTCSPRVL